VTPVVVGQNPVWPAAPAIEVATAVPLSLFDTPAPSAAAAASAAASVVASPLPVAALAAALQQTVAESGLFYEAHLAEWLSGQRTPASLAAEPQNRLADAAAQLPLDWPADDEASGQSWPSGGAPGRAMAGAGQSLNPNLAAAGNGAARGLPEGAQMQAAARAVAHDISDVGHSVLAGVGSAPRTLLHGAADDASQAAGGASQQQQSAPTIHPATVPLVRQQLDLLATGQFRWTGEAWPGARLDWTIEQDGDEWQRSGSGAEPDDQYPWRTHLTLSLPSLGTVDADLTLTGTQLLVRVQASPGGAARLAEQGETFRQRLAAAGIDLSALSIREIGGGAPGATASASTAASAAQATTAYARSAKAGDDAAAARRGVAKARPDVDYDWDLP
jgi:hypothetical protein